ncbi:hypothetical protein P3X46_001805 [Hevea brasiliensis]|uniref:Uncharacterized protein n=1 Tax=Hevea brasiliensis TaxID=3981 RepID=A0ABQ9NEA0_HEVBR|nr:uncharacterized protein LOC110661321 [Hevea brasiliensis]XP_021675612.1 uncharacterized protein LOC110661321 [Hevea brasiliensis]KAJ9190623.1 hypothetical protein P3X46_001805 [Hevea brasiliensis]
MAAFVPIDLSSDSDELIEDDDFDASPIRRSTEFRLLPSWATTAGKNSWCYGWHTEHISPRIAYGSNGFSSSVNDHSLLNSSRWLTTKADHSLYFMGNGNMGQNLDIYGSTYHLARPSLTNSKGYMRDHYGRHIYEDFLMYENNGRRKLPPKQKAMVELTEKEEVAVAMLKSMVQKDTYGVARLVEDEVSHWFKTVVSGAESELEEEVMAKDVEKATFAEKVKARKRVRSAAAAAGTSGKKAKTQATVVILRDRADSQLRPVGTAGLKPSTSRPEIGPIDPLPSQKGSDVN